MFDQLIDIVKEQAGAAIMNNSDVPSDKKQAAISTTADGVVDHLKGLASSGGIGSITDLLSGGAKSAEVSKMSKSVAKLLSDRLGIDQKVADGIIKSVIPMIMDGISNKINDPSEKSFTVQSVLGSLGGSKKGVGGLMDAFKKLF